MKIEINLASMDSYTDFLTIRTLPRYKICGKTITVPDEFASRFRSGVMDIEEPDIEYVPSDFLFDYQRDITKLAIRKKCFAVFADCGLGKTLIMLEFAKHAMRCKPGGRILLVSPLMVVDQTIAEADRFYGGSMVIEQLASRDMPSWCSSGQGIGITNYEALRSLDTSRCQIDGLCLDESSILKSHYGKYGEKCIELSRGVEWKLCMTGTPAPNDRIEYANHAVLLGRSRTTNEFLARFFVNKGQTNERWILKPHSLKPFYRAMSDWSIFLSNPGAYGWHDNITDIPHINIHIEHVPMTAGQRKAVQLATGQLVVNGAGGIGMRSKLGQIGKGFFNGENIGSLKPEWIRQKAVEEFAPESVIIWCLYNAEQASLEKILPDAISIAGDTPYEKRLEGIRAFQSGKNRILISKPKVLGFGLNLQIATRQIFSGLQDSYESFYQAVKRSNRIGSTRPLNVHIPVTEVEEPMVDNVLRKATRVESDTQEQESLFKEWYQCQK